LEHRRPHGITVQCTIACRQSLTLTLRLTRSRDSCRMVPSRCDLAACQAISLRRNCLIAFDSLLTIVSALIWLAWTANPSPPAANDETPAPGDDCRLSIRQQLCHQWIGISTVLANRIELLRKFVQRNSLDEQARPELVDYDDRRHEGEIAAFARHEAQHGHVVHLCCDDRSVAAPAEQRLRQEYRQSLRRTRAPTVPIRTATHLGALRPTSHRLLTLRTKRTGRYEEDGYWPSTDAPEWPAKAQHGRLAANYLPSFNLRQSGYGARRARIQPPMPPHRACPLIPHP